MSDKLLITTRAKCFCLDNNTALFLGYGDYYGATWTQDSLYLSVDKCGKILKKSLKTLNTELIDTPNSGGVHQILYRNGILAIVDTEMVCVWFIREKDMKVMHQFVLPPPSTKRRPSYYLHPNSIFYDAGFWYILNSSSGFEDGFYSQLYVLDDTYNFIKTINLRLNDGLLHNIFISGEQMYSTYISMSNKTAGGFVVFDLKNQTEQIYDIRHNKTNGLMVGLAVSKDHIFLGEGVRREDLVEERRKDDSYILILDRSFNKIKTVWLKNAGQIRDIRLFEGDLAHNGIQLKLSPLVEMYE